MSCICLVSGGLDSYLGWWRTGSKPIFIDYGQEYVHMELRAALYLYPDLHVVEVRGLPVQGQRYIPCRNLIFTALATHWDCDTIYVSGMDDDVDVDKSPAEFARMSDILSLHAQRKVVVDSPWWGFTKAGAVASFLQQGGSADLLKQTYSCYSSAKCNQCDACYRWAVALLSNQIDVPAPSLSCLVDRGVKQLWHRSAICREELFRALDFMGIRYTIFYIKDNDVDRHLINECFLNGDLIILAVPCSSGFCTDFAQELRKLGVLFHGVFSYKVDS